MPNQVEYESKLAVFPLTVSGYYPIFKTQSFQRDIYLQYRIWYDSLTIICKEDYIDTCWQQLYIQDVSFYMCIHSSSLS